MDSLRRWIAACSPPAGQRWLAESLEAVRGPAPGDVLLERFPAARRQLGQAALPAEAAAGLEGPDDPVSLAGWTADEAARVALLLAVAEAHPAALATVV